MRRFDSEVALACLLAVALVGCGRGQTSIPSDAQDVHVVVSASEVRLDPARVHAGDVYLVIDAPLDGSIVFVGGEQSAAGVAGPLSDAALSRLAEGDTEGTSVEGMDAGGCSPDQNAEDRGRMGPCGNVMKVVVVDGKYAIIGGAPEVDPATGLPPPMAVLEVLP